MWTSTNDAENFKTSLLTVYVHRITVEYIIYFGLQKLVNLWQFNSYDCYDYLNLLTSYCKIHTNFSKTVNLNIKCIQVFKYFHNCF